MTKPAEIFYLDNILREDYLISVNEDYNNHFWTYGPFKSIEGFEEDDVSLWIYPYLKSKWNPVVYQCIIDRLEILDPKTKNYQWKILDSYGGQINPGGASRKIHTDKDFQFNDKGDGFMTFCFFPGSDEWNPNWSGDLQFFDDNMNVIASYSPKPNTCVVFDSNIPHRGLAPTADCPFTRKHISFKSFVHKRWDIATEITEAQITDTSNDN
jgi:hypothetical protein